MPMLLIDSSTLCPNPSVGGSIRPGLLPIHRKLYHADLLYGQDGSRCNLLFLQHSPAAPTN